MATIESISNQLDDLVDGIIKIVKSNLPSLYKQAMSDYTERSLYGGDKSESEIKYKKRSTQYEELLTKLLTLRNEALSIATVQVYPFGISNCEFSFGLSQETIGQLNAEDEERNELIVILETFIGQLMTSNGCTKQQIEYVLGVGDEEGTEPFMPIQASNLIKSYRLNSGVGKGILFRKLVLASSKHKFNAPSSFFPKSKSMTGGSTSKMSLKRFLAGACEAVVDDEYERHMKRAGFSTSNIGIRGSNIAKRAGRFGKAGVVIGYVCVKVGLGLIQKNN